MACRVLSTFTEATLHFLLWSYTKKQMASSPLTSECFQV